MPRTAAVDDDVTTNTSAPEETTVPAPPKTYATREQLRDAVLALPDIEIEDVWVEPWKMTLKVRGLTGAQIDQWRQESTVGKGRNKDVSVLGLQARLVVRAVVDDNGERVFSNRDADLLQAKSAAAIACLFDAAARLSGVRDEDVEELTGKSGTTPNGASATD
jgi:hypothetical protein